MNLIDGDRVRTVDSSKQEGFTICFLSFCLDTHTHTDTLEAKAITIFILLLERHTLFYIVSNKMYFEMETTNKKIPEINTFINFTNNKLPETLKVCRELIGIFFNYIETFGKYYKQKERKQKIIMKNA